MDTQELAEEMVRIQHIYDLLFDLSTLEIQEGGFYCKAVRTQGAFKGDILFVLVRDGQTVLLFTAKEFNNLLNYMFDHKDSFIL